MKTPFDPRHIRRQKLIQNLFSWSFRGEGEIDDDIKPLFHEILNKIPEIDNLIKLAAPERPTLQISKVDLSILRLATFELLKEEAPLKVVVDEAVELAKEFGGEASSSFINGVLGTIITNLEKERDNKDGST